MPYSKFTLSKAIENFQLTLLEGDRFMGEATSVKPSTLLKDTLKETVPWGTLGDRSVRLFSGKMK